MIKCYVEMIIGKMLMQHGGGKGALKGFKTFGAPTGDTGQEDVWDEDVGLGTQASWPLLLHFLSTVTPALSQLGCPFPRDLFLLVSELVHCPFSFRSEGRFLSQPDSEDLFSKCPLWYQV